MYAPNLDKRDRTGAILAVALVHIGLALGILNATGRIDIAQGSQRTLKLFDVAEVEPPPPPPPPVERQSEKPRDKEGAAAPKNIESKATPVAAPKPKVEIPVPPKIVVAETPAQGNQATQGASDVRGPGTGAGGVGTGTGSGGSGSGTGGGGAGLGTRPRLVSRSLSERDYPSALRRMWPSGARVLVIFDVQVNGRATGCHVYTSSGIPQIDQATCRLVETRLRFAPARDTSGRPRVDKYAYMQAPVNF
jgi:periplasmic protein TonB